MPVLEIAARVDARGLSCPMPIVKTAQAVKPLASGALVEVFGDLRPGDEIAARGTDEIRAGMPVVVKQTKAA